MCWREKGEKSERQGSRSAIKVKERECQPAGSATHRTPPPLAAEKEPSVEPKIRQGCVTASGNLGAGERERERGKSVGKRISFLTHCLGEAVGLLGAMPTTHISAPLVLQPSLGGQPGGLLTDVLVLLGKAGGLGERKTL